MILLVDEKRMLLLLAAGETLELAGWRVDACRDGLTALRKIEGSTPYDLLVLDNDVAGVGGLTLARRARDLRHRARTLIVIISSGEIEGEARRAGADACLMKPLDVCAVARTLARLRDGASGQAGG